jgi:hypothetical protein
VLHFPVLEDKLILNDRTAAKITDDGLQPHDVTPPIRSRTSVSFFMRFVWEKEKRRRTRTLWPGTASNERSRFGSAKAHGRTRPNEKERHLAHRGLEPPSDLESVLCPGLRVPVKLAARENSPRTRAPVRSSRVDAAGPGATSVLDRVARSDINGK